MNSANRIQKHQFPRFPWTIDWAGRKGPVASLRWLLAGWGLLLLLFGSPVPAEELPLSVIPATAAPGETVTVTGAGFQPGANTLVWGGWPPRIVGSVDTSDYAVDVTVSGNYAYVADSGSGLQVVDIGDPAAPIIVGGVDTPGNAYGISVSGNHAYVADGGGLQVVDISDPAAPVIVGGVDTPGDAYGITVSGNYAYVADSGSGLQVVDIGDPAAPIIVGGVDTPGNAQGITVSGDYAYVTGGVSGVTVIAAAIPSPTTWIDSSTLQIVVPSHLPRGTYDVTVKNPDGTIYKAHSALTITEGLPQDITFRYPVDFYPENTNGWTTQVHSHGSINLDTRDISNLPAAQQDPFRPHNGEDWNKTKDLGEQIHAIADGEVVHKGWLSGFGNMVVIRHNAPVGHYFITSSGELLDDVHSLYAHLLGDGDHRSYDTDKQMAQSVGEQIVKGDPVGQLGYSGLGKPKFAHLHFEILKQNPLTMPNPNPYNWDLSGRVHPSEFIANNMTKNITGLSDVPFGTDIIIHAYGDGNPISSWYPPIFSLDDEPLGPYREVWPDVNETNKQRIEDRLNPCSDEYPHGTGNWKRDGCDQTVDKSYNGELFKIQAGVMGTATWRPMLPREGQYELSVFVPSAKEYSGMAEYVLFDDNAGGLKTLFSIDQSAYEGNGIGYEKVEDRGAWIIIGTFDLSAGQGVYLRMAQTFNHVKKTKYVGADAVRFRYKGTSGN